MEISKLALLSQVDNQLNSSLSMIATPSKRHDSTSSTGSIPPPGSLGSDGMPCDPMLSLLPAPGTTPTEQPKSLAFFEMGKCRLSIYEMWNLLTVIKA